MSVLRLGMIGGLVAFTWSRPVDACSLPYGLGSTQPVSGSMISVGEIALARYDNVELGRLAPPMVTGGVFGAPVDYLGLRTVKLESASGPRVKIEWPFGEQAGALKDLEYNVGGPLQLGEYLAPTGKITPVDESGPCGTYTGYSIQIQGHPQDGSTAAWLLKRGDELIDAAVSDDPNFFVYSEIDECFTLERLLRDGTISPAGNVCGEVDCTCSGFRSSPRPASLSVVVGAWALLRFARSKRRAGPLRRDRTS